MSVLSLAIVSSDFEQFGEGSYGEQPAIASRSQTNAEG